MISELSFQKKDQSLNFRKDKCLESLIIMIIFFLLLGFFFLGVQSHDFFFGFAKARFSFSC